MTELSLRERVACPCCGYASLVQRGGLERCEICFWEDDGSDNDTQEIMGFGNNACSLLQARKNFLNFGACQLDCRFSVRAPYANEPQLRFFGLRGHRNQAQSVK
ncbi:MAG: CPCC family cysteine-rich protein [Ferrimonas sp.]